MGNLPVKKENNTPLLNGMEDEIMASLIESVMPKLKPMIGPALEKLKEYLGDNERFIIMRQLKKTNDIVVVVMKNIKEEGNYNISNKDGVLNFSVDKLAVEGVYKAEDFVEKLLTGQFTQMIEDNGNSK